jgi:hypothetical protein
MAIRPDDLAQVAGILALASLALLVLRGLASGYINIGQVSLSRAQLLLSTFYCAAAYFTLIVHSLNSGVLPNPPAYILAILVGSNGLHLAVKAAQQ